MTNQNIYDETRFLTYTDSSTYTDADLLRGLNLYQGEFFQLLLQAQGYRKLGEDLFVTDFISTVGLVAGQAGFNGEYAFDSSWVKVTAMELQYKSTEPPVPVRLYDQSQNAVTEIDEDTMNANFSVAEPYVRFQRDSYLTRPLNDGTTVTDGIKIWAVARQADTDDSGDTPIGEPNFHNWFVLKLALRYGKFRPGVTRADVVADMLLLENKINAFYKQRVATPKNIQPRQTSFA